MGIPCYLRDTKKMLLSAFSMLENTMWHLHELYCKLWIYTQLHPNSNLQNDIILKQPSNFLRHFFSKIKKTKCQVLTCTCTCIFPLMIFNFPSPNNDFCWTHVVRISLDDLYFDVSSDCGGWTEHRHPPTNPRVSRNMTTQAHLVFTFSDFYLNIVKLVSWEKSSFNFFLKEEY